MFGSICWLFCNALCLFFWWNPQGECWIIQVSAWKIDNQLIQQAFRCFPSIMEQTATLQTIPGPWQSMIFLAVAKWAIHGQLLPELLIGIEFEAWNTRCSEIRKRELALQLGHENGEPSEPPTNIRLWLWFLKPLQSPCQRLKIIYTVIIYNWGQSGGMAPDFSNASLPVFFSDYSP